MLKKNSFIIKIMVIYLLSTLNIFALETTIIPLKKPILDKVETEKKIMKTILKPRSKPKKEKLKKNPEKVKTVKKEVPKIKFLLPKTKPITVKKEIIKAQETSKYYNKKDYELAKKSIQAFEKGQWPSALSLSKKAQDKSINDFIQWRHLLTKGNQASFYDYQSFINRNENYPRINRVKYLAEHKLSTEKISPKKIINWFGPNKPLSGYGMLILGESFIKIGQTEKGIKLIKDGWITADLSRSDMKFFRKKYKKYLNADDYIKRADYLAWENKYWDLKRMLRYLPKRYELLYNARQILMSKSYGVDKAIKNVPSDLKNDAGLNYDRLKWRRKRGRIDDSLEILLKIKKDKNYLVRPDKWWKERSIIARALIYKKKYELAYKISSEHSLDKSPEYAEAEWISGWIALSFLDDPILAIDHFNNFYQNVGYPISLSRGAYWLGKSYEKIGDKERSVKWYEEATKYLTTYYGQLAHLKVKPNENFQLEEQIKVNEKYKKYFFNKDLVKIVYLLDELNKDKYSKTSR